MHKLETFLGLTHANYSPEVLNGVSHNANIAVQPASNTTPPASNESDDLVIHRPYSFTEHKEFLQLSRNVLHPSLCLFEKAFGW
eukprot:CAMPEP_0114427066 /NCGR_PEP_ID=MMETSP0103-20121206/8143_1 /TAXON_ID=37642 ORGANISM="Paraphysomonas imperforata, Strain PA2" /NCGR_SAMPLE_ID=MMETSP0103 /ASSEMBLY_ACC=CAM_ASM_000201 /LENGTH=83 /DNA_ID=CAMNT_0001596089 /DNA_START=917 /DNA_END=1165 /DNA_ORIENTATION=-